MLNFVYRELNQVYETEVVLTDIKVAFYNGNVSSLETASLGELRKFVAKFIVPDHQEEVARAILGLCAERLDDTGTPVSTLEVGRRPDGRHYEWQPARLGPDGTIAYDGNVTFLRRALALRRGGRREEA